MAYNTKKTIFLVDDDPLFLKALEIEFTQNDEFDVKTFSTGEACIKKLSLQPDVIVLDYYLNEIDESASSGLKTLTSIKAINDSIPVIMLSSQDSIDIAVNCMHHHAFDYIVKSETAFIRLRKSISSIFLYQNMGQRLNWYMDKS